MPKALPGERRPTVKVTLITTLLAALCVALSASAADLQAITLNISFTPRIEQTGPDTVWEIGFALQGEWRLDKTTFFEVSVASKSEPISPRVTFASRHFIDDTVALGGGVSLAWLIHNQSSHASASVFALGGIHANLTDDFSVDAELQQTILGLNRSFETWRRAPVTPIPRLVLCGRLVAFAQSALGGRIVLEPIWIDAQTPDNPVSQVSEHLLLHPAFDLLLDYRPASGRAR